MQFCIKPGAGLVAVTLFAIGCGPKGFTAGPARTSSGIGNIGPTSAAYELLDDRPLYVIWLDHRSDSGGGAGGGQEPAGFEFHGEFKLRDGRLLKWEGLAQSHGAGSITIDGTRYDLAGGSLFLVTTTGGEVKITQLKRDAVHTSDETLWASLQALAKDDPDVARFYEQAAKAK